MVGMLLWVLERHEAEYILARAQASWWTNPLHLVTPLGGKSHMLLPNLYCTYNLPVTVYRLSLMRMVSVSSWMK